MNPAPSASAVKPQLLSKEFSSETLAEGVRQLSLQQCKAENDTQILEWEKELEVGVSKQDTIYIIYTTLYFERNLYII